MVIRKSINQTDLWEIKHHLENTAGEMIKCYTLAQLSLLDGIDTRTIKVSGKYLPVRVDNAQSLAHFKRGGNKKPYATFYIRLDEIKDLFRKRNKGKNLIEEYGK